MPAPRNIFRRWASKVIFLRPGMSQEEKSYKKCNKFFILVEKWRCNKNNLNSDFWFFGANMNDLEHRKNFFFHFNFETKHTKRSHYMKMFHCC